MSDQPAYLVKPRRRSLEDCVYSLIGTEWCDNIHPPGDHIQGRLSESYIAHTLNDGSDLYIGFETEWLIHLNGHEAAKLVRVIVWNWWIKGTGCGMRRWLWYKLLSRRCRRQKRFV